mmetsp:Transcript_107928/g.305240  ORF Transcript_107928/g.305240 Transcript_107928/m.305240 type:complete len:346 (-) Transcript_107928:430-1467(-)
MWRPLCLSSRAAGSSAHAGRGLLRQHPGAAGPLCARGTDALRGQREVDAEPVLEERGLELVGHVRVHHGAVAVARAVVRQTLQRLAPADVADLEAADLPVAEALEMLPAAHGVLMRQHVDEGVPETCPPLEVHGQVAEVVAAGEALLVEQLQQRVPVVVVGQVSQHNRGALLLTHAGAGRVSLARTLLPRLLRRLCRRKVALRRAAGAGGVLLEALCAAAAGARDPARGHPAGAPGRALRQLASLRRRRILRLLLRPPPRRLGLDACVPRGHVRLPGRRLHLGRGDLELRGPRVEVVPGVVLAHHGAPHWRAVGRHGHQRADAVDASVLLAHYRQAQGLEVGHPG